MKTAPRLVVLAALTLEPFLGFAAENRSQLVQSGRLLVYALAAVVASFAALALARRLWRDSDPDATALAVAVAFVSFFHYSLVFSSNPAGRGALVGSLVAWLVLTAAAVRVAFLIGGNETVRLAIGVFAVSALFLQIGSYAQAPQRVERAAPIAERARPPEDDQPNVYWLVLDSHDRPDVMDDVAGHDLRSFVDHLEAQGFDVSGSSRTSYPRTILSLSSTLEMRYVLEPGHEVEDDYATFSRVVTGESEVARRLRARGYRTLYGEAGGLEWSACRERVVDACLPLREPWPSTGELERALLDLTPLGMVDLPVSYSDPQTLVKGTERLVGDGDGPFFAFVHVLAPHFPYRYRDDCSARGAPLARDASTREEEVEQYVTQVRCVDALVVRAVDAIVDRDPSAIVLVQSDHGSDIDFTWSLPPEEWTREQVAERFSAFNAMRLPAGCDPGPEGTDLVNTFRVVLACIDGREPDLLGYRAFGHPIDDVGALVELTPEQLGTDD